MRNARLFFDTNIFMYAAGRPHHYKNPCVRILDDVEKKKINAFVYTEVPQELLYRYSHIGISKKGIELCRNILRYPVEMLPYLNPSCGWQWTISPIDPVGAH